MEIYTIWTRYPESEGLFPDIADAVTEFLDDDNPTYMQEQIKKHEQLVAEGVIESFRVVILEVPEQPILDAFSPQTIKAEVRE